MTESLHDARADWRRVFPFEPYPTQVQGIEDVIETLVDGGVHLLEGPCGTGKTLIGLTAALSAVHDPSTRFARVLVITSKKQQLSAFENDLAAINEHADIHTTGLSLVGKADLCPYVSAGEFDRGEVYHKCISLRDNTRRLMAEAVRIGATQRQVEAAFGLESRAESIPEHGVLSVNGEYTPYEDGVPEAFGKEYCPFYASHIANSVKEKHPLSIHEVTSGEETLTEGSKCGTCPHTEMRRLFPKATVLMGNYQHAMDPQTVGALTSGIVDESTLLVCDEAHGLVDAVRDQLSYDISYSTLNYAVNELEQFHDWLTGQGHAGKRQISTAALSKSSLGVTDVEVAVKFLKKLRSILRGEIVKGLEAELGDSWRQELEGAWNSDLSFPLQNPRDQRSDRLTRWAEHHGYEEQWLDFLKVSRLADAVHDIVARKVDGKSPDGSFAIGRVFELFERWWLGDGTEYFRRITLHPRSRRDSNPSEETPWRAAFLADIRINNSIPQNEIAATLDAFGGAVLMSATLEPLDIYEEETGVAQLKDGTQPSESLVTKSKWEAERVHEEKDPRDQLPDLTTVGTLETTSNEPIEERRRTVSHSQFEPAFPVENRASFVVDAPKFTYSNRWPPKENRQLRRVYEDAITTVVRTTPGNVLVCMPSYGEAAWAGGVLETHDHVSKETLVDGPNAEVDTEELRLQFIDGQPKVLVTSLRGTLTEGVDFDGDELHGVVVCGVPITQTGTPLAEAIQTAYDYSFDGNGFEYAFAVPAVRKARQAIGRVIRGANEVGVRVVVDRRYATSGGFGNVRQHFPSHAREEFVAVGVEDLPYELETFWERIRGR